MNMQFGELSAQCTDVRRTLYRSGHGVVEEVTCSGSRRERGVNGYSPAPHFVLPYAGAFVWHTGRDEVFADANQALYCAGGEEYGISHPVGGDASLVIRPGLEVAEEMAGLKGEGLYRHPGFRRRARPAANAIQILSARLRHSAQRGTERLQIDEMLISLLAALLHGESTPVMHSAGTRRTLDLAKAFMHESVSERISLGDVAAAAGVSPVYLTQLFTRAEGIPLYKYLTRLRLTWALNALAECADLTELALDLGFSSHSHFSASFRSHFGTTPSSLRAELGASRPPGGTKRVGTVEHSAQRWARPGRPIDLTVRPLCSARSGL